VAQDWRVWTDAFPELNGILNPIYALKVQIALGENLFNETKDPLRAWEVAQLCAVPAPSIPLPTGVAQYFSRAAIDLLRIARDNPKNAADQIAKVLGFEAQQGKRYVGFRHYRDLANRARACEWVFSTGG
jgi:hypothetical protein